MDNAAGLKYRYLWQEQMPDVCECIIRNVHRCVNTAIFILSLSFLCNILSVFLCRTTTWLHIRSSQGTTAEAEWLVFLAGLSRQASLPP